MNIITFTVCLGKKGMEGRGMEVNDILTLFRNSKKFEGGEGK
jgi:hypothetical protein